MNCPASFYTVWKFQDFSVIQILRVIDFEESRSYKTAASAIVGPLNFVDLVNFSLQKVQNFIQIKIQSLLNVAKWHIFDF